MKQKAEADQHKTKHFENKKMLWENWESRWSDIKRNLLKKN